MSSKTAVYRKGDVVLVAFPYTTDDGQTQTKRRPAVIISNDYNNTRLDDVLLVPLTSNVTRATREPTQVVVEMATPEGKAGGIRLDSVIDCTVIATIPKTLLVSKIGAFPNEVMERVDMCLMIALSIGRPVQADRPDRPEGEGEEGEQKETEEASSDEKAKSDEKPVNTASSERNSSGGGGIFDKFAKFDRLDKSAKEDKSEKAEPKPADKTAAEKTDSDDKDDQGPKRVRRL